MHETIITLSVLSEDPIPGDADISDIVVEATIGDYSMQVLESKASQLSDFEAKRKTLVHGSDPDFFGLEDVPDPDPSFVYSILTPPDFGPSYDSTNFNYVAFVGKDFWDRNECLDDGISMHLDDLMKKLEESGLELGVEAEESIYEIRMDADLLKERLEESPHFTTNEKINELMKD